MKRKRSFQEWVLYKIQKSNAQECTPEESLAKLVKAGIMNPDGTFTSHYPHLGEILESRR